MKKILMALILLSSVAAHARNDTRVVEVKQIPEGVKVKLVYWEARPLLSDLGLIGSSSWTKTVDCKKQGSDIVAKIEYARKPVGRGTHIQDQYESTKSFRINVNELCAEGVPLVVEVNGKRVI